MKQLLIVMWAVALFCLAVGVRDLVRKDYIWAALAFVCVVAIALTPIPTHAVKVDLGVATGPKDQTSSTSRP
jgi:hypothetical protein